VDDAKLHRLGGGHSVFTRNLGKGFRFANALQAGTVWINTHMDVEGDWPWGGFKESGFGKELSIMGMEEYTQVKAVVLNNTE
jgi:acyl-CoA reductase-like NAD-dependent aldehyde dehydrogenase